jgi:hypothetical protein
MGDAASVAATVRDGRVVWEVAGKAVSVSLSLEVVSRLGMAVREGFKALPRRGLETGGLLIGARRKTNGHVIVEIDDFEAIESEHAAGPSYLLSEADRRLLEQRIAARGKTASVVGFYRSHTRSGFALTVEDDYLFSNYFRKASDVFLLIKSNDGAPPTGGFIIREGGKVLSHTPYAQFQFNQTFAMTSAAMTPAAMTPAREAPGEVSPVLPEPPPASKTIPSPAPQWGVWMARWPVWLGAVGAAALAVVLALGVRSGVSVSTQDKALPLALNVTNTGAGLRLSWDHRASSHAHGAVLWIRDGKDEQRVELDGKQLSEGSVMYWPQSSDVNFRLQLLAPLPALTESVRAIGGPSRPPVSTAGAADAVAAVPPVMSAPAAPQRVQIAMASRKRLRTFELPLPTVMKDTAIPDLPGADPLDGLPLTRNIELLQPVLQAKAPAFRDEADSPVRISVEPVPSSRLAQFARRLPLVGKRYRHPDYVPPAPLREPPIPNRPQRNVAHDVNIDVKVYVNPAGKVDYSEVLSKVGAADRDLAAVAVFSARRYEFVPARAGDDTVPGEVILHYQFGPGALASGDQAQAAR